MTNPSINLDPRAIIDLLQSMLHMIDFDNDAPARAFAIIADDCDSLDSRDDAIAHSLSYHLREPMNAQIHDFLLSYDICPIHRTDIDSCADDELTECAYLH